MSSAEDLWRSTPDTEARKRTVRSLWPQLAEALDGMKPLSEAAEARPLIPDCVSCGVRPARVRIAGEPICVVCTGRRPWCYRRPIVGVDAWKP